MLLVMYLSLSVLLFITVHETNINVMESEDQEGECKINAI